MTTGNRDLVAGPDRLETVFEAAAGGDPAAWSALLRRYTVRVRAVARRHRLAHHDAEDVVQATWLRLFEHIDGVREPSAVGAWLETTARRESLRLLRARQREQPTDEALLDDEPVAAVDEERLVAAELRTALAAGLDRLPDAQRRLMMALLADPAASYAVISRSLDMPVGSIGPTRARSLARLRDDPTLLGVVGDLD